MRRELERTTGVLALLMAVGCFLGAARPASADAALPSSGAQTAPAPAAATALSGAAHLPPEVAPETEADDAAPEAEADDAAPVHVLLRFEGFAAGEEVVLSGAGGAGGTIELPENGTLALTLRPGAWSIAAPDGLSAGFTLRENASIDAVTGDAWTDGEQLTVTREARGSVCVSVTAAQEQSVLLGLRGDGYDEQRALFLDAGSRGECTFWGLPVGVYTLTRDGAVAARVTVTEDARSVNISLP